MKEGFVLYQRFYDAIKTLSFEEKGKLFDAIYVYQLEKKVPESCELWTMAFAFFKTQFDVDDAKYERICERNRSNGLSGGKPKKPTGLSGMPKNPVDAKASIRNRNRNRNRNKDKEKILFTIPSIEEIKEYCKERGNGIEEEVFFDFYQSKGWMVGSNKMKDWKACVRTWEKKEKEKSCAKKEKEKSYGNNETKLPRRVTGCSFPKPDTG